MPVCFKDKHRKAFRDMKDRLLSKLSLHTINPDKPFILQVDASGRAVGAAFEQFEDETTGMPTSEEVRTRKRVPVAFCSRKLTAGQLQWTPRKRRPTRSSWPLASGPHGSGFNPSLS